MDEQMGKRYRRLLGPNVKREVDEEIEFHIEARAHELMRAGLDAPSARQRARDEFGDITGAKRECLRIDEARLGRTRRAERVQALLFDVRTAWRSLRRSPGYALTVFVTLALAIGASTAVWTAVNAVVLRPLPFESADRLMRIHELADGQPTTVSPPNFMDIRTESRALQHVAAWHPATYTLTGHGDATRIPAAMVTADFFDALGKRMALGRDILPDEAVTGQHHVTVLSHSLWRTRFGSDPAILGQSLVLDGQAHVVIGVAPPGFAFPEKAELWTPRNFDDEVYTTQRGAHYLSVIGRLRDGVTAQTAQAELTQLFARLERDYPQSNTGSGALVEDLRESIVGDFRRPLFILFAAVLFVLLVASANTASLALVRTFGRGRELAVRAALGAGRSRVVRMLLSESLLLSLSAGLAGIVLATWGVKLLILLLGDQLPRIGSASVDAPSVLFALACSIVAGLLFGLFPALRSSRVSNLYARIGGSGRGRTTSRAGGRARSVMVTVEVALALLLLVGAGLMLRSFDKLRSLDPGFTAEGLLSVDLSLPETEYQTPASASLFFSTLLDQVRALPGVTDAGAVMAMPMSGTSYGISVEELDGGPAYANPGEEKSVQIRVATPGYFEAAEIKLLRGRVFTDADRVGAQNVVIVSESAAELLWPGIDPLGHSVELGTRMGLGSEWPRLGGTVAGVVADVREFGPADGPPPMLYAAHAQFPLDGMTLAVRTAGPPEQLTAPIRSLVQRMDPDVPLANVATGSDLLGDALGQDRFYSMLLTAFAATALLLAMLGIYGITSSAVASRTREIGLRVALGADPRQVLGLILFHSMILTAIGIAAGLAMSLLLTRAMRSLLYEVSPTDPGTITTVALTLTVTAILAAWVPARRATAVEPTVALREE